MKALNHHKINAIFQWLYKNNYKSS